MLLHEHMLKDKRTRFYMPVQRILQNNGVKNPEALLGNQEIQPILNYLKTEIRFSKNTSVILDFGKAIHGGIRINIIGPAGRIRIKFGESVSECIGNSDQQCSRKDAVLELPHWGMIEYGNTVFRFIKIENLDDTEIRCLNILAVVLERNLEVVGSFESSDLKLNTIWETAVRTVHLCMQDYIYDGAKRDRIVWMGDMHPEIHGILCAFSDTSIIRDSLEFLIRQTPADQPMNKIWTYSCWFIISVRDYFIATGDQEFLKKHALYILKMLQTFIKFINKDGSECIPDTRFLDWPNEDSTIAKHEGIQALMVWMMQAGTELLQTLELDNTFVIQAEQQLRCHLPAASGRKAPAALISLIGLEDRRNILENDPFHGVSPFYGYYILLAKETIPALELIRNYWGAMLDFGATSFWEDFDLNWTTNASRIDELPVSGKRDIHADFGNYCYKGLRHSLSHGWSCGPAPFLMERVLGINWKAPERVSIHPDIGDLEYVKGSVPCPNGIIKIEFDQSGKLQIDAPSNINIETNVK